MPFDHRHNNRSWMLHSDLMLNTNLLFIITSNWCDEKKYQVEYTPSIVHFNNIARATQPVSFDSNGLHAQIELFAMQKEKKFFRIISNLNGNELALYFL